MIWLSFVFAIIALLGIDQWTKYIALVHMSDVTVNGGVPQWNGNLFSLKPIFELLYESNEAGAMGITFPWARAVLIVATIILLVALVLYLLKYPSKPVMLMVSSALIIAGGIGNLIDRICRGYVPDFIRFYYHKYFPYIFNVADIYVCVGAVILAVFIIVYDEKYRVKRSDKDAGDL